MFSIFPRQFLDLYSKNTPPWGFNGLGYIVFKRTYARPLLNGATEEWWQTIARCIEGAQKIGAHYTQEEAERLFDHMFYLRCNMAGRMLWQLGTSTVDRFGANSLLNCWFVSVKELRAFEFIFENLMLGGGVGFSIRREDVHELPRVKRNVTVTHQKTTDACYIVPDSREGWVKLLHEFLRAYFVTGKSFTYSTILVRSRGEKINGFGGTASGPMVLIEGIEKLSGVVKAREGKKLRSVDVLDICNIIGSIVVAGNVRRSAQIALGDPDDMLFLKAKRWDLGNIPNWRAMSNNTIYADSYDHIMEHVWDGYAGNGEPYGFFNLPLSQKYGRLGEEQKDNCEGTNPCGEVSLASYESCNLSELYLNNIESEEQLLDCAKLLYKTQKAVAALPFLHEETNAIVHKNMRLGLGVTGICQSLHKLDWLDPVYRALRTFDKVWSKERKWNESIKLTTLKPSGTLSLLAGATPGVHPSISAWYVRRIRMSSSDPLVEHCREAGLRVEFVRNFDGTDDHSTVVVEFLCESKNALLARETSAIRQLELVKKLQTIWSDNAVSVTVYYHKHELDSIRDWMSQNFEKSVKSVSFLLHSDHNFLQAPYEPIDEEVYKKRLAKIKPITSVGVGEMLDSAECSSGSCPIR
jgi:ribonucleoside-triphosphate reductase